MLEENGKQSVMITWTKRLLLTCTSLGLLATNVLTLTSMAFNAALSGALATATGVRTVSNMHHSRIASQDATIKKQQTSAIKRKAATKRFGTRLASRTKRVAAKSIAAIPAEAIPFLGVGVLIAVYGELQFIQKSKQMGIPDAPGIVPPPPPP